MIVKQQEKTRHSAVTVPLRIETPVAVAGGCQPLCFGVPLARGSIAGPCSASLHDAEGRALPLPVQVAPLAHWSDGSVKWLLVEFLAPGMKGGTHEWILSLVPQHAKGGLGDVEVRTRGDVVTVDTGTVRFDLDRHTFRPFLQVRQGDRKLLPSPARTVLTDRKGRERLPRIEDIQVETSGPVRTTICLTGQFPRCRGLRFRARLCFFTDTGLVRARLTVHNPNRARHRGGLWDLGDAGSFFFQNLSLDVPWQRGEKRVVWRAEQGQADSTLGDGPLEIYQDSSGGENWSSRNHVNREGRVPCRFQGYRLRDAEGERRGLRASPVVAVEGDAGSLVACVPEFWQQFPKAVEFEGAALRLGLFPRQWDDLFELQGGERKTYTIWLRFGFGEDARPDALAWGHEPARVVLPPEWYCSSEAVPHLSPASDDSNDRLRAYVGTALTGPRSFFAGREKIDEYGWRNYGDVWADHEEAYYAGTKPVISHYNNQYDVVYGAIVQMMRTGEVGWMDVFDPLARHVMDIDIYHTDRDKTAYNGGLFWHTDHYADAGTSTHRTYSQMNAPKDGRPYGGGPGNEHNYASGLLHYYYLTGDLDAREAVLGLADWVIAMDDGGRNVFGILDDGATGLASMCTSLDYHGPGRGAANSLNVLLDAWLLSAQRVYLHKAEELIRRCIHPDDDPGVHNLLHAEYHWSYTMFLAALSRYLDVKDEAVELDRMYAYAQRGLLRYAEWMVDHERRYLDHPEELEYPTETWAAQEFRKSNALWLAARHAGSELAIQLRARAEFLSERAWKDLLGFETCDMVRPVAILMTEGARDADFRTVQRMPAASPSEHHSFATPEGFVPQKLRVMGQLRTARGMGRAMAAFLRPSTWKRIYSYFHYRGA